MRSILKAAQSKTDASNRSAMIMVSLRGLSFLCVFLISQATAQPEFRYNYCFEDKGNYTTNSTYQTNLNTLLTNLTSNTEIDYGFYNFSYGQNSDTVNITGLCRGDVTTDGCRGCLYNAGVLLPQLCPTQKVAIGGYDQCMLQFGVLDSGFMFYLWSTTSATDWDQYYQVLGDMLDRMRSRAASGDSRHKFAVEKAAGPKSQTIFAAVQCWPDLSEQGCNECLVGAISRIPDCCKGRSGGRVIRPTCNFRYENYLFYEDTADAALTPQPQVSPPSTPTNSTPSQGKRNKSRTVIAIVVPIGAFIVLLILICIYVRVREQRSDFGSVAETDDEITVMESLEFNFDIIRVATSNFSNANKLGQGGFGPVYKGRLSNGQEVAVKRLSMTSEQGDTEFKNEVLLMTKLQHRNLVRLLGFCLERKERLLVYEFLPNKSLDYFLFDPNKRACLDWKTRYKIIEGIAHGLLYLHEDSQQRIIHRDLKPSNILLDAQMNPKISDFGMARLFTEDQTQAHASRIMGTYGYMAPEYAILGRVSVKSDVFSFGVVILEIVSGRRTSGFCDGENVEHLLSYAWKNWVKGTASNIVDVTLKDSSRSEIMRCIHIGLLCVQKYVADRPALASVVLMLGSNSLSLPVPLQPAFFMDGKSLPRTPSQEYSSGCSTRSSEQKNNTAHVSVNEDSISELYPR